MGEKTDARAICRLQQPVGEPGYAGETVKKRSEMRLELPTYKVNTLPVSGIHLGSIGNFPLNWPPNPTEPNLCRIETHNQLVFQKEDSNKDYGSEIGRGINEQNNYLYMFVGHS